MKTILFYLLTIVSSVAFSSCGAPQSSNDPNKPNYRTDRNENTSTDYKDYPGDSI